MKKYIRDFIKNRPLFYCFIRPKEAEIFHNAFLQRHPSLDFGCGDGFFAEKVFGKKEIDVGLDVESSRIQEFEGVYRKSVVYDGGRIPFKDNHFLEIVSNSVLEHINKIRPVLNEINRVLKPNGVFFCTVMTDKWEDYLLGGKFFGNNYKKLMRRWQKHYNLYSLEKWTKTFEHAGFKVVQIKGYLDKEETVFTELLHFLSFGSLVNYKLFGKWVIFPKFYDFTHLENLVYKLRSKNTSERNSASLFFKLEKVVK